MMKVRFLVLMAAALIALPTVANAGIVELANPGFDDDVLADDSWAGAPSGWGGNGATQNMGSAQLTTEHKSAENVVVLNAGQWINQNLLDAQGNQVLVQANETYTVGVWVARRSDVCSSVPAVLTAFLQETDTWTRLDSFTYDSSAQAQDSWTYHEFALTTGADPAGNGVAPLAIVFQNETQADTAWHAQVVLDSVSIVPEPATMVLLGLGSLVLRRKKKVA